MSQRDVTFSSHGWEDYCYWQEHDWKMVERINQLIEDARRNPHAGRGKPEPLKHKLSGAWARRITQEHRLIYKITDAEIIIAQCRFHY
jgi:toxin YoeB